jgi:hypothetical protein
LTSICGAPQAFEVLRRRLKSVPLHDMLRLFPDSDHGGGGGGGGAAAAAAAGRPAGPGPDEERADARALLEAFDADLTVI